MLHRMTSQGLIVSAQLEGVSLEVGCLGITNLIQLINDLRLKAISHVYMGVWLGGVISRPAGKRNGLDL